MQLFREEENLGKSGKGEKSYWINLDWKYGAFSEINFMNLLKSLLVPLSIDPQRCSDYQKP